MLFKVPGKGERFIADSARVAFLLGVNSTKNNEYINCYVVQRLSDWQP